MNLNHIIPATSSFLSILFIFFPICIDQTMAMAMKSDGKIAMLDCLARENLPEAERFDQDVSDVWHKGLLQHWMNFRSDSPGIERNR